MNEDIFLCVCLRVVCGAVIKDRKQVIQRKWVKRENRLSSYGVIGVDGWMKDHSTQPNNVIKTEF